MYYKLWIESLNGPHFTLEKYAITGCSRKNWKLTRNGVSGIKKELEKLQSIDQTENPHTKKTFWKEEP